MALEWVYGAAPELTEGASFPGSLIWQSMSVRWGTKGFTLGVDVDGTRVVVCYAYSPGSMYQQSLYTALQDQRGFRKMRTPTAAEQLHEEAKRTGLFAPAGRELKCLIDRAFTDAEMGALVAWCESVAPAIRKHAVSGGPVPGPPGEPDPPEVDYQMMGEEMERERMEAAMELTAQAEQQLEERAEAEE